MGYNCITTQPKGDKPESKVNFVTALDIAQELISTLPGLKEKML